VRKRARRKMRERERRKMRKRERTFFDRMKIDKPKILSILYF
jgi:hypothetical protein